jgi:segregation and condensation protein A
MSAEDENRVTAAAGGDEAQVVLAGQEEFPFALVQGEPMTALPRDLYIPPDALEVFLETFEGPLDVLLYLIKRQNLDILNIPIAEITRQYTKYIEVMQELRLELAAEYLLMAAMLAEIKSRMLLPRPIEENDEDDPRAELIRRLQEYERFKTAAEEMEQLPRMERDTYPVSAQLVERKVVERLPDVTLKEMLVAFYDVMQRANMYATHQVQLEALSVRQRMSDLLVTVGEGGFVEFATLFDAREGRMGVVVTFLAVLELVREMLVDVVQNEPYGPIHIQAASGERAAETALRDTKSIDELEHEQNDLRSEDESGS